MSKWYCPREELANKVINLFETGLESSVVIVAPRRKGKTNFLLTDIPAAAAEKYHIVYNSFWKNANNPAEGLITDLKRSLEGLGTKSFLQKLLTTNIKKAGIENDLLGKVEIEFAANPVPASTSELQLIGSLLDELVKTSKKPILLLLDEIQHLATNKAFATLSKTLRTLLDERQGGIKSIFTGSSRNYMQALMHTQSSAFYNFSYQLEFPDMGEGFIDHIRKTLAGHGVAVSIKALTSAYEEYDKSPYWLRKLAAELVIDGRPIKETHEKVFTLITESEGLREKAAKLKPADKIVFLAIADSKAPFSAGVKADIDKNTGVKGNDSNIQKALGRLMSQNLISNFTRATYLIEQPGLRKYLIATDQD